MSAADPAVAARAREVVARVGRRGPGGQRQALVADEFGNLIRDDSEPAWVPDEERGPSSAEVLIELASHRIVEGDRFVLDVAETVPAVWGDGHQVAWAAGEPLLLVGPDGVGKTTVLQQLDLALIGVRGIAQLFGLPVVTGRRVLYIAADRPTQAQRSMNRMVTEKDRELLHAGLVVWRGPLPFDLVAEPGALLSLARRAECDVVSIDSLKDVASKISSDETGQAVNAAFQTCCAEGVDVVAAHHQRKAQAGAPKPKFISDVYGSRWITAGCGSVFMLWGEAGDPVVELSHLKQPDETIGPYSILHDHVAGSSSVVDRVDAYTIVTSSPKGTTVAQVAMALFGNNERNSFEKARRQLKSLAEAGKLHYEPGLRGVDGKAESGTYFPISHRLFEDGRNDY
jgi:replicative DNA helicase